MIALAGEIKAGAAALVMHVKDHVATTLKDLQRGERVEYQVAGEAAATELKDSIPFGHKFAIVDIPAGTEVRKYGEVIGRSTAPISRGQHVHVHNMEGIRGRGDQAGGEGVS